MITTEEALSKLKSFGERQEQKKIDKANKQEQEYQSLVSQLKSLIPRIKKLYPIVSACADYKVRNEHIMLTEGVTHEVGFFSGHKVLDRSCFGRFNGCFYPSNYFGIEGGGCDGGDLKIDIDTNEVFYTFPDKYSRNCILKMKKIINEFDMYEKKVLDFVEKL